MLAHRANAQPDIRMEQQVLHPQQHSNRDIKDHILLQENFIDKPKHSSAMIKESQIKVRQRQRRVQRCHTFAIGENWEQKARQAQRSDINSDAADDLIRLELDSKEGMHQRHHTAGQHSNQHRKEDTMRVNHHNRPEESAGQHHSFHRHIDNAAALRNNAPQRGNKSKAPNRSPGPQRSPEINNLPSSDKNTLALLTVQDPSDHHSQPPMKSTAATTSAEPQPMLRLWKRLQPAEKERPPVFATFP